MSVNETVKQVLTSISSLPTQTLATFLPFISRQVSSSSSSGSVVDSKLNATAHSKTIFKEEAPAVSIPPAKDDMTRRNIEWDWLPYWNSSYTAPRRTIVLCHGNVLVSTNIPTTLFLTLSKGLWGFDKLGFEQFPRLQLQYWGSIQETLRKLGAKVLVAKVPSTGTIAERAKALHHFLEAKLEKNTEINFVAHSMVRNDSYHNLIYILNVCRAV